MTTSTDHPRARQADRARKAADRAREHRERTRLAMVVDAAIVVVDAVSGVQVSTEKAWATAAEFNLPAEHDRLKITADAEAYAARRKACATHRRKAC